ncbi:MAG: phosphatidylethanolamine N-methyltransferase family protein [Pseudomonadaceae bacterium]|nr:phosphatidylethanolamine N-methyltransferase family protein [Pseudomonadaceae bacterium]
MLTQPPGLWKGQLLHVASLLTLLPLLAAIWVQLGEPYPRLFWLAVAVPVCHQIFVWLAWRVELNGNATSRLLGFHGYLAVFFTLFGARFISLIALGWVDRGSLQLNLSLQIFLVMALALPGLYAMYSVRRYFGMARAAGADHFNERYRAMPLVSAGIFRFTSNGMYLYAFLLFWAIAIGFDSANALAVAAFSHAYIWVHYFATEKPDMEYLYASR